MGILKPNDVYQGRWTTITLDGEELAEKSEAKRS